MKTRGGVMSSEDTSKKIDKLLREFALSGDIKLLEKVKNFLKNRSECNES